MKRSLSLSLSLSYSQKPKPNTPPLPHFTPHQSQSPLIPQIITSILHNTHFNPLHPPTFTTSIITQILQTIPRLLFQSPRCIGIQQTFRHRHPLKQRYLAQELQNREINVPFSGPVTYRDPVNVSHGLNKALRFYEYVERQCGFVHNEITVREMAVVIAKGSSVKHLWEFLTCACRRQYSFDGGVRDGAVVTGNVTVTVATLTCLIKVLGEQGLVNEALETFYRMKKWRLKPDVYCYNTMLTALCRVGMFRRARFMLDQMEIPGFRCPPDVYTYTILISFYCKSSLQTRCKKAIRRRLWEANHLFRIMVFKGFKPDVVTYNALIDGCCKTYRIERALELFGEMEGKGCVPNRATYDSFIRFYSAVNELDKAVEMMRKMVMSKHGVPSSSSYTPVIHAMCEAGRVVEARELLVELVEGGSIPREYTYKLVCAALDSDGDTGLSDELRKRIEKGINIRYKEVMRVKPIMQ